jgi:hypothetical protein
MPIALVVVLLLIVLLPVAGKWRGNSIAIEFKVCFNTCE